jgi:hypothetical protein
MPRFFHDSSKIFGKNSLVLTLKLTIFCPPLPKDALFPAARAGSGLAAFVQAAFFQN